MKLEIEISQTKKECVVTIEGDRDGFETFIEWIQRSTRINGDQNEITEGGTILRVIRED